MLDNDTLIIDADSHWTEPHDLFTRVAPVEYRDRVPRVEQIDGQPMWVFDGHVFGQATAAGVIGPVAKWKQSIDRAVKARFLLQPDAKELQSAAETPRSHNERREGQRMRGANDSNRTRGGPHRVIQDEAARAFDRLRRKQHPGRAGVSVGR